MEVVEVVLHPLLNTLYIIDYHKLINRQERHF